MIRFNLSPALSLALTLALASAIAAMQPLLAIASPGIHLSQVRGEIASVWTHPRQPLPGIAIASSQTANPIQDSLGCSCALCTSTQNVTI